MDRVSLDELDLVHFRSFSETHLSFHPRFNIISGANGVGKTNLLEAIYLFGVLRSFRTTTRRDLIELGHESASLKGLFGGAAAGLRLEVEINPTSRIVSERETNASQAYLSITPL